MTISLEQFQAMTAEQQAQALAAFQAKRRTKLTLKVSEKGAVSVYGMGKWPVTLYGGQWERLLDSADEIRQFLADNATILAVKE